MLEVSINFNPLDVAKDVMDHAYPKDPTQILSMGLDFGPI